MTSHVKLSRVAVTGLGAVTPLGVNVAETWSNLLRGSTGIRQIRQFDRMGFGATLAAPMAPIDWLQHFSPRRLRRLDPSHRLAILAAREALGDSGVQLDLLAPNRAGIFVGTSLGGMIAGMEYDRRRLREGRRHRALLNRYPMHFLADEIARDTGFVGPRSITSTACTASALALSQAIDAVRDGDVDIALAGGVDPLTAFTLAGFYAMQNVAPAPCAPFSQPAGLTLGEAGAFLVLEPSASARARGAHVYAELLGYALNADGYHATAPDPSGQSHVRLLRTALADAGVAAADVDYINAHGTGTATNDAAESRAVHMVFGPRAANLPVSSIKGALGHTLGAAGALEALCTVKAVAEDIVPPTAGFTGPRTGCDLDYVPNAGRAHPVSVAISQNFAFGGNNAAIVIGKPVRDDVRCGVDHDVVITGMGVVSPIGIGRQTFLNELRAGSVGIRPTTTFDTGQLRTHLSGAVADFDPGRNISGDVRRMDRLSQLVVAGAELALRDAGIRVSRDNAHRIGLVVGTNGPIGSCVGFHRDIALDRPQLANPKIFPNTVFNAGLGQAAVSLRIRGCNVALTMGQASGALAIAKARTLVRRGHADIVIAGGVDELLYDAMEGCATARVLSPLAGTCRGDEAMRPFDRRRNGMILGEGAGLLVLERRAHAQARGAPILADVAAAMTGAALPGSSAEAGGARMTQLLGDVLRNAGLSSADIDYVAAGAFGMPIQDAVEAAAIMQNFRPDRVAVGALQSLFGASAASTGLAACATVLGMAHRFLPCGLGSDDPDWEIDLVDAAPRSGRIGAAMINGLALGGGMVSLILCARPS